MARCLLDNLCLANKYWTYALNMAFYVKNMLLHSALQKTPFEMMRIEKFLFFRFDLVFLQNSFSIRIKITKPKTLKKRVFSAYNL